MELELFDGDLSVEFRHELNYGIGISTQSGARNLLYGRNVGSLTDTNGNGGTNSGPYEDDQAMAFKRGVWANQAKGVTDIRTSYGDFGSLTRLLYFYDFEIMDQARGMHTGQNRRIKFGKEAKRAIGRDVRTLENYAYWDGYLGDIPVTVRVGDQVIRWGEANFFPVLGLVSPPDLNRLFTPGVNLRELNQALGSAFVSMQPLDWLTVEAFYQYDFASVGLPPGGSFMSLTDNLGPGFDDKYSGQDIACLDGTRIDGRPGDVDAACVYMGESIGPDGGQMGLMLQFNVDTKYLTRFGLHATRMHNRLPNGVVTRTGIVPYLVDCPAIATLIPGGGPFAAACAVAANQTFTDDQFAVPIVLFEEGLDTFAFTAIGNLPGGFTWNSEITYRADYPIQVSRPELISAVAYIDVDGTGVAAPIMSLREADDIAISATGASLGIPRGIQCEEFAGVGSPFCNTQTALGGGGTDGSFAYGVNPMDVGFNGHFEHDVVQGTFSFTKLFPNVLWGDTMVTLLEVSYAKVLDLREDIQFEVPHYADYYNTSNADDSGWGYRFLARNGYPGIFGTPLSITATLVWIHDVYGVTPANLGLFVEGRKQAIFDLQFKYMSFQANIRYLYFGGNEEQNVLQDRDTLFINFRYTL